ncbi:MAG: cytochrome bc complex cytochrome b subunit [Halodesulfurarchaeum sp.]
MAQKDSRLELGRLFDQYRDKVFPVHGTFFLGELALFAFVGLVATGTFLGLFYEPSTRLVLFRGEQVPAAYASVLQIQTLSVGLLVRRIHHWSAQIMIAAILVHMARVFFTGAYKKPRDVNWLIGAILLQVTILAAYVGYLLPFDEFAVTATGIGYQMIRSVPWVGDVVAKLAFAGSFPNPHLVPRFFTAHVFLIPALISGLIGLHLLVLMKLKHTQHPGVTERLREKADEIRDQGIVGVPLWPEHMILMAGIFFAYAAGVTLLATFVPVHPVSVYGPSVPGTPSMRPDWYLIWIYGILKLIPSIDIVILGGEITAEFIGGVVIPGGIFGLIMAFPFIDAKVTGDVPANPQYEELDRPSDRPGRTAIGVGAIAFFLLAGAAGYLTRLPVGPNGMLLILLIAPLLIGAIVYAGLRRYAGGEAVLDRTKAEDRSD